MKPRITTQKGMLEFLEAQGWTLVRTGRHHLYKHPTRPGTIAVPIHNGNPKLYRWLVCKAINGSKA